MVGISQALLSEYERGTVRIHGELVAAFAKALRVSADELLGLKTQRLDGFIPDRRFFRRLQKIEQLSRRNKQALLKTIDGFLKGQGQGT
jgi:transcriptional regulator with XRE-family HTH domain